ncbi:unnamed protein product [Cyprideis torosa]|uniref:Structural maintenance of chromosomes protein 5 n=1 Tax=Cyprideis torosa TaxID=163714 RepID=A0A7R8ZJ54_9CRUS|nr:unnamed protein product [Cyprideis torosa]CAG0886154.1 unnamed protein product [Cyprideis torosa]
MGTLNLILKLQIIKRYDEAKESLSGLEESFRKANENTRLRKEAMEQKKGNWRRGVQELISKIDDNFKRYMQLLRCRGHVSFMEPQDLDDFKNYGITLSVAFRQSEELQRLERHLQSGGEKSVSTVLYMLALQELTEVPFRFVDEINQGMDAFNERKVFEVMSRIACRENCSQYFVLTPKLLPDLKLPAELCVGIVFREGAKCHQTGDPREQQGIDVLDAFIQQY